MLASQQFAPLFFNRKNLEVCICVNKEKRKRNLPSKSKGRNPGEKEYIYIWLRLSVVSERKEERIKE
jgi:hypothetical protein